MVLGNYIAVGQRRDDRRVTKKVAKRSPQKKRQQGKTVGPEERPCEIAHPSSPGESRFCRVCMENGGLSKQKLHLKVLTGNSQVR